MKHLLLAALLLLSMTGRAHAQGATPAEVSDIVNSALGSIFGGGELPVKDAGVRGSMITQVAKMIIEVAQTLKIMELAIYNSQPGAGPTDEGTSALIARLAQLSEHDFALLYGGDLGAKWLDAHPGYHEFPEGGWIRNEEDRYKRSLETQRQIMLMLQERKLQWEENHQTLIQSEQAILSAEGTNSILQAGFAAVGVGNRLQQVTQALIMANANAQSEEAARAQSELMSQRIMERYFMTNGGKRVPIPDFENVGLLE